MTTEIITPETARHNPASAASIIGPQLPLDGAYEMGRNEPAPMPLDLMELELALDLNDLSDQGFCGVVKEAAKAVGAEYLFDLPASGLVENAQRIAVICLSREDGGNFGLVLLDQDGDRVQTVTPDAATADLVRFAKAFVSVLEKL